MRLLIVSCSQTTSEPYYKDIVNLILKTINTQNIISDTELVVIQRNSLNLIDYLYELDTSHINPSAIHNFEAIDLFFVIGDRTFYPWNQSMWNINRLIRMCLRLKRSLLLVSGCGFESLVFQLSCGFIGNISLLNKKIEIDNGNQLIKPTKKTDLFFDEIEGVLYAFNFETNQWYKKRDCGLQNHHKLEQVSRKSRYLVVRKKTSVLTMTKNIEQQCQTLITHALLKGVPTRFMVQYISKWRANPVDCNYNILTQTALGPSVIQFQNIVAIQFKVTSKYPSTIKILQNFIFTKLQSLFIDSKIGKIQQFLNRQQYDKPSLDVPFRRVNNIQCSLPKLQFINRLRKSTARQKSVTRSKITSNKQSKQNSTHQSSSKNDWWDGTRVSISTGKKLFYSQAYKTIRQQYSIKQKQIKRTRQNDFLNRSKLQYYDPNRYLKQSNTNNIQFSEVDN